MSLRRVGWLAAMAMGFLFIVSCGQVYRPVVIPIAITPPNPSGFHAVFGISANVSSNPGTALQVDVSGDSDIGAANMGVNPTHIAILPNDSRVFVTTAGSLFQGEADTVTGFTPAADSTTATGLGTLTTFSLAYGTLPVFVNTTQNNSLYVANYGTNSVSLLDPAEGVVKLTSAAGAQPVALAETFDGLNLYVLDEGSNLVTDLSPTDLTPLATIPVGKTPIWAAVRPDDQRLYVVTQGDGQLYTIRIDNNTVISAQPVGGPGANFVLYDKIHNRLFVTNPSAGNVYVFDATTDPPTLIATLTVPRPHIANGATVCASYTCGYSPAMPVSVAALPDGSRFYVASYMTGTATSGSSPATCPDPGVTTPGCIIPQITVYNATSFTVKTTIFPLIASATSAAPFAVSPAAYCVPVSPYTPASARFRMSAAAAADSSRVYASVCDGGFVAIVNTTTSTIATGATNTPDTLVTDLDTPFSAAKAGANGQPPLQNPIFLLSGQ
jgi:DNA-binding beta-propeller fold protein YncE